MRGASKPRRRAGCPGRACGPDCSPPRRVQCRCLCAIVPHTHELSTGNRDGEAKQGHRGWRDGTDAQGGTQRARGSAQAEIAGWKSKDRRWRLQSCAERNVKGGAMQILPPSERRAVQVTRQPVVGWLLQVSNWQTPAAAVARARAVRPRCRERRKAAWRKNRQAATGGRMQTWRGRRPPNRPHAGRGGPGRRPASELTPNTLSSSCSRFVSPV